MDEFIQSIANAMEQSIGATLTVFLLSMIPIAEARVAIPFGMTMKMNPGEAFGWAFLGTSLVTPILLLILIPIINALSKTKFFSKIGKFLYDKFESKSKKLAEDISSDSAHSDTQSSEKKHKLKLSKSDLKKMGGTALFVAIPVPLTGVWTGSAVASIVKIGFVKGLISVIIGNAVACGIITLLCWAFAPYVGYITLAFTIIAICVVLFLIIKFILYKPKEKDGAQADTAVNADSAEQSESTISSDTVIADDTKDTSIENDDKEEP